MQIVKPFLLVLSFSIICSCVCSQTTKLIKFDFATKQVINPDVLKTIKNGDFVSVQVDNFNPYLYQAQIAFSDSSVPVNTPPGLFSSFFNMTDLSTLTGNLNSYITKIFPGVLPPAVAGAGVVATRSDSIKYIERQIINHKSNIQQRQIDLTALIQSVQTFIFNKDILLLAVKKWNLKATDITDFTAADQTLFYNDVTGFVTTRNNIRTNILTNIGNYESEAIKFGKLIQSETVLRGADSLIRLSNKEMLQGITAFDTIFTFAKFELLLVQLINLQKDNFSYTSFPTQVKTDITKVDLSVSPWNTSSSLSSYKASWQFPILQKSYFNFSTAFFISGLHNDEYFAEQKINAPGDTSYLIKKENSSNMEIGVSALFHYGWYFNKGTSDVSFHFTFGPGLTIQKNPLPRLLLGLGIGIGRKNKVIFSTGVIAGEAQRQREYYESTPSVKFSPSDITAPKLKVSGFLSIGYKIL